MMLLDVAKVVTTPANPLEQWLAMVGTFAAVWVAYLAYRYTKRGDRQKKADEAHAAELLRYKAELDRDNAVQDIHGALYGHMEGVTTIPGLVQVVVGKNGEGTVRDVATAARDEIGAVKERQTEIGGKVDAVVYAAEEAKTAAAAAAGKAAELAVTIGHAMAALDEHTAMDAEKFEKVSTRLNQISRQQEETHEVSLQALQAVETINGLSSGELAERGEGRAIAATIPPENQTAAEKHYVEAAEDRSMGRDPKGT